MNERNAMHRVTYWTLTIISLICLGTSAEALSPLPQALPSDGTNIEGIAPVFDFDTDSCYPAVAIGTDGAINGGHGDDSNCRETRFLSHSNLYHRSACSDQKCVHIFGLYFERDETGMPFGAGSHRHDWEHVAVWTTRGTITHVGVSAHGNFKIEPWADVPKENGHPKVVYHREGLLTHALRFAKPGEKAENSYGRFVTPPIASWFYMKSSSMSNAQLRRKLNAHDFGSAHMDIKNPRFGIVINRSQNLPSGYSSFDDKAMYGFCLSSSYDWDESQNPLGSNRCSNSCECDGARTCSSAGWCG